MSYVNGIDVSDWQGDIDWNKAVGAGVQFAILRVSHGKGADMHFERNVAECEKAGIPWGAYHYAKPGAGKTWEVQADFFLSLLPKLPPLWCWLDAEESGGLDKVALEGWYFKFIKHVEEAGQKIGIYTSPGFWNSHLALTNWAKGKPLWVAHWGVLVPTLPLEWTPKANPNGYPHTLHQYAVGKGEGAKYGMQSADIDLDRFNGEAAKFKQVFGVAPLPLPDPAPVDSVTVIAKAGLNIRTKPDDKDKLNIIGGAHYNSTWLIEGEAKDSLGRRWVQVGKGAWLAGWAGMVK